MPPPRRSAGQPPGHLIDHAFVQERLAALGIDRRDLLRRAAGRLSARSLQRVVNEPGLRLSLTSAAALADVLECGSRDVLLPSRAIEARLGAFGLAPHPPFDASFGDGGACAPWLARPEEQRLLDALAARRPVVVVGEPGSGKTSLARRVGDRFAAVHGGSVAWLDVGRDPDRARAMLAESLGLFYPFPGGAPLREALDERFARLLWARRRLLVVDGVLRAANVQRLVAGYRGPCDLLVLTDASQVAAEVCRHLGGCEGPVELGPPGSARAWAWLLRRHHGDPRLAPPPDAAGLLDAALAGEQPAVAALDGLLREAARREPGLASLLEVAGGRPATLMLASDLLRGTTHATLADLAGRLATSAEAHAPLLRQASPAARQLFWRLGALGGLRAPLDWVAAAADLPVDRTRVLCDELGPALERTSGADGRPLVGVAPPLASLAEAGLSGEARWAAALGLLRRARDEARQLARLAPPATLDALHAGGPLITAGLRALPEGGDRDVIAQVAREILVPLLRVLPGWRTDGVEALLWAAVEAGAPAAEPVTAPRLRLAAGRWLVAQRADFPAAEPLFREAALALERLGLPAEAAEARCEEAITLFATHRIAAATALFEAAADLARRGLAPPIALARHLANLALVHSRRPGARPPLEGWRRSLRLFDEAREALRSDPPGTGGVFGALLEVDRAIAARVLGKPGWRAPMRSALADVLDAFPAGDPFRAYPLATALASGLVVSRGLAAQRRELRDLWWSLLARRGPAAEDGLRRIGEAAFYLGRPGARAPVMVNRGTAVTNPPIHLMARLDGTFPVVFDVEPMRPVFDLDFLEAAARFVWDEGGPGASTISAAVEALRGAVASDRPRRR